MEIEIDCTELRVVAGNTRVVTLVAGIDGGDLLSHFKIRDIADHFSEDEILDYIGVEKVKEYFDLYEKE